MPSPVVVPRQPRNVLLTNPYCAPLREMYDGMRAARATSWNQVEQDFLDTMSSFDSGLPVALDPGEAGKVQSRHLSGAIQNGKGDWFNNVIALLLERCAGIDTLYVRRRVPGLIIAEHNLDGVYPGDADREIEFLLERVLFRGCTELRGLRDAPPEPIPVDVPPSPAVEAAALTEDAAEG